MSKVVSYKEAAKLVPDNAVIGATTFGLGGLAEQLLVGIEESYLKEQHPSNITFVHSCGIGNGQPGRGSDHLCHEGLTKRVIAGHTGSSPTMGKWIGEGKVEGYLLPQGVIAQIWRSTAGKKPGVITKVGLNTFVDPRIQGAKVNVNTTEDIVEVIELDGEEWLRYKNIPVNVAFIRGTYADEKGNLTVEQETGKLEILPLATAAHNNDGIVIAQVKGVVKNGTIKAKDVIVPGSLVDYIVVSEEKYHWQTMGTNYNPCFSGEVKIPLDKDNSKCLPLNPRKVVARRAAMLLEPSSIVNLGIGMPEGVAAVASEEGVGEELTLTIELGSFGGVPSQGLDFGAAYNSEAQIEHQAMFDFYDGGGLNSTFLGLAQTDQHGNINVSQFGPKVTGPGGFINISQNTKNVCFLGMFTVGGKAIIENKKIVITKQGRAKKFLKEVEQITFSGEYASKHNMNVFYVTERGVFDLVDGKMRLIEIAPGVDLQRDILDWMDFEPIISKDLKEMDPAIFAEEWGGLKAIIDSKR